MKYLAVDTANTGLTVIVKKEEETFFIRDENCGTGHSVYLMPAIEELLTKANVTLKELDFFVAVIGAGSFTGIRIGVSTISALCKSLNKPCLAVTSFDTMAYTEKDGAHLCLINAKHGSFYACGYNNLALTLPPCFIDENRVKELEGEYSLLSIEEINGLNAKKVDPVQGLINAIEVKKEKASFDLSTLSPLYVRKSQAEEGR